MTARTINPDCRRRPHSIAVALVLTIAAVLLATGCMTQGLENQTNIPTTTLSPVTAVVSEPPETTIHISYPVSANGSYWIILNPISNISVGDKVFITGLTNVPPNSSTLHIYLNRIPSYTSASGTPPDLNRIVTVEKGEGGINTFTLYSDTFGLNNSRFRLTRIDTQVYFSDSVIPGFDYPANLSTFYIIGQVTPAVTVTTKCPTMTENDKKYLRQFSSDSYMLVCQVLRADLEKANKSTINVTAGVRRTAGDCAKLISDGSYPDSEILRHSRDRIVSGYTKMANGDLSGGFSEYKEGNKIGLDFSISSSLCTASG